MLEPARTVIEICGGPQQVADMARRHKTRVYRWTFPRERGGTNGFIPVECQVRLLTEARLRGIPLKPEHFFLGGAS